MHLQEHLEYSHPVKQNARHAGFTLLELLIAMAIIGILAVLGEIGLTRNIQNAQNDQFIETLGQDINTARSLAMARSQRTQLTFNTLSSYTVTFPDDAAAAQIASASNTRVTLGGVTPGDKIICASGGFCLGYSAAGALKSIPQLTATTQNGVKTMSISVLGLTRLEQTP